MSTMDVEKIVNEHVKDLPDWNYMLGRGLMQPFKPANSGSRALMNSVHAEHFMVPSHAEVPLVQTGFETEFGKNSTSYIEADSDYIVINKVNKFTFNNDHYFLILQNAHTGVYDYVERVSYNHNTEGYGYMWDNKKLDSLNVGDYINAKEVINTSTGFDEYSNKENGVNLVTLYLSLAKNMEDSIILSESAAKKLETNLVRDTSITINDNDILLNLYGEGNEYKSFPDVGEPIKNGIFCSIRRLENDNVLYSLSKQRLKDIMISDRNILLNGIVADIDVYSNNIELLKESVYNRQLYRYYQEKINFCNNINNIVAPLAINGELSYELQLLYGTCRDIIAGQQFFKDKQFNNVIMEVTVIEPLPMAPGNKLADRYGGKGVVSEIIPDDLMPLLDNGTRVEIVKNQSTCINRENVGQLHEQSLTFIGMRILDFFKTGALTYTEMCQILYKYVSIVDKDQANFMMSMIDFYDEYQAKMYIDSIMDDDGIILSTPPFTTPINIDTLDQIYKEFPWIKPYEVLMPIEDSNGNITYRKARRPLVVGKIYNYILKQYAEEKFSVTSLSATNLKSLNTRSKAAKMYETKYTKTPIMFGAMESGDLCHVGMQYVVMNLMLYSSSPQARRLFEELLIGDPYNINIQLDADSRNRNAEIINVLLKTMGLRIVFKKTPKVKKFLYHNVMYDYVDLKNFKPKTNLREIMGKDDELELMYGVALHQKGNKVACLKVMYDEVDDNGKPKRKTNLKELLDKFDEQ